MTPSQMKEYLQIAIPNKQNTMIVGPPGIGKTVIVYQIAKKLKAEMIVSHAVSDNPTNYKGLGYPDAKREFAKWLPYGELEKAITAKKLTIWFFDDFGQAPPAVQSAAMQLFWGGRVNGHKISDNVVFIIATNRKEDKANVAGILEPVKSRFRIIHLTPSHQDWIEWATENEIPAELIAFIHWRPEFLFDFKPTMDLINTPNPRNLERVGRAMKLNYPRELEHEIFAGDCGEAFSTEFCGFLRLYRNMVSPDVILTDPNKFVMPEPKERPAVLYALSRAIAMKANRKNMDKVTKIAGMLPAEYSALLINLVIRQQPDLKETAAYVQWSLKQSGHQV